MSAPVHSAIYRGRVRHRRRLPVPHAFAYDLYLLALDLDELDRVFAGRWLWSVGRANLMSFRREDFLGDPRLPLDEAVRRRVAAELGRRPEGRIVLVTQLRAFGVSFNPVSFYHCHDAAGRLDAVVAEITNTPWRERHAYVLDVAARPDGETLHRFRFDKAFHVSPFMGMEQEYSWTLGGLGERLFVHMENTEAGTSLFDATLDLRREPLTAGGLARCLLRFPFMTGRVLAGIYGQALRLKLKGVPFHVHPDKRVRAPAGGTP